MSLLSIRSTERALVLDPDEFELLEHLAVKELERIGRTKEADRQAFLTCRARRLVRKLEEIR